MLSQRKIRLLCMFVMLVITPVITLPWNTIGKSIAQQEEDDDAGADDGETIAFCAPGVHHGRAPQLPPPPLKVELLPPPVFAPHHERPRGLTALIAAAQSTRVRLQI